ncbi:MAG: hypothetical protein IJW16_07395 [Clostridia bacterium]|nr:hypothetical protein [Clostridia bacterium]
MTEKNERDTGSVSDMICENRRITRHRFFLGYAFDLFRHARLYAIWKSALSYFRKFRAVALTVKITSFILAVLQTGALVLFSTAIFLVILPILGAFMLGVLLTALLESRKSNRYLQKELEGIQVYVLFLSKRENPFFCANAKSLANDPHCAVIVVSPYWLSGKGISSDHFFCTVRREHERIYLVRRYYFFQLRKRVLGANTAYLY